MGAFGGPEAESWLARKLLPGPPANSLEGLAETLVDGYYLQQESLREFLISRSDDERFAALSRMVGAGALAEFLQAFQSSKGAWARAVRQLQDEVSELSERLGAARRTRDALRSERTKAEVRALAGAINWSGSTRRSSVEGGSWASSPTTPRSSGSSARSLPTCTTNGNQATVATCPKPPWALLRRTSDTDNLAAIDNGE
jgi:hypothetical protein